MLDTSTLGHSFAFEAHTISILLSARDEHYHNPAKDADQNTFCHPSNAWQLPREEISRFSHQSSIKDRHQSLEEILMQAQEQEIGQIFPPLKPCLAIFHILVCPLKGLTQFTWGGEKQDLRLNIVHRVWVLLLFKVLFCLFDKVAKFLKSLQNSCQRSYYTCSTAKVGHHRSSSNKSKLIPDDLKENMSFHCFLPSLFK